MKKHLPLLLILALAAFLRIYRLDHLPISLFGDEIDVGYHAASLWSTGRDYLGNLLPTYIHSLSEWRAPLLMYVVAPFVGILGMTAFAVRLPIALLGVLNVYLLYLLTQRLFRNSKLEISLIAAAIMAITPWHLHYSRTAFEVTLLLALLLAGVYWFLTWLDRPNRFPLWPLPFALTFYTYSTANLFTPLLILALFSVYRPKLKNLIPSLAYLLLLLPIAYQLLAGPAAGRFNLISIFNDPVLIDNEVVLVRTEPWVVPGIDETIFHNKPLAYLSVFGRQYLQAFSPQFLFTQGDPLFRHSIGSFGQLPWLLIPFLVLGVAYALTNFNSSHKFLLAWLLLSPIPSALTQGGGMHATRLFIMLPPLIVFSALGLVHSLDNLKLKNLNLFRIYYLGFSILVIFYVASYWHQYADHYRFASAKFWQYGYQQAFAQLQQREVPGRVFINNTYEPSLLRFAFYTQLPPAQFQQMFTTDVPSDNIVPGFNGFQFGERYYFGQAPSQGALQALLAPGDLYLAAQLKEIPGDSNWAQTPPAGLEVVDQVKDLFGGPLFAWISSVPSK